MNLHGIKARAKGFVTRKRLPWIIVVATVALSSLLFLTRYSPSSKPPEPLIWPVDVIIAEPKTLSPQIILYGQVESPRNSQLTAAIPADVLATPVLEGTLINEGEVIVELDDAEAQLTLRQRSAEVKNLKAQIEAERIKFETDKKSLAHERELLKLIKKKVEREEALKKQQVTSEARIDEAQQAFEQQSLSVRNRELTLANHPQHIAQLEARLEQAKALEARAALDVKRTQIKGRSKGIFMIMVKVCPKYKSS